MLRNKVLTRWLLITVAAYLAVQGEATFEYWRKAYDTKLGKVVTGIAGVDGGACCPEGMKRAQNINDFELSEPDVEFEIACPCIPEGVEEGDNGWTFLTWTGEEPPMSCEEEDALHAAEAKERKVKMNQIFCEGLPLCDVLPASDCTQVSTDCIRKVRETAQRNYCPIERDIVWCARGRHEGV